MFLFDILVTTQKLHFMLFWLCKNSVRNIDSTVAFRKLSAELLRFLSAKYLPRVLAPLSWNRLYIWRARISKQLELNALQLTAW